MEPIYVKSFITEEVATSLRDPVRQTDTLLQVREVFEDQVFRRCGLGHSDYVYVNHRIEDSPVSDFPAIITLEYVVMEMTPELENHEKIYRKHEEHEL